MKNSQKGFIVPLVIILVLLIGAGAYYYMHSYNVPAPITKQSASADESSNLATSQTSAASNSVVIGKTSSTSTPDTASWKARVVGGQLSLADRQAILVGTAKVISVMNSGDITLIRKYASIVLPASQLAQFNKASDQQILALMKIIGPIIAQTSAPTILSSAQAIWTVKDKDHVDITIKSSDKSVTTIQAIRIDGVWY